jgi:7-keto-8-aminopelargonate synthetase-like enzyme
MKSRPSIYETAYDFANIAVASKSALRINETDNFDGRTIKLDGRTLKFFGNCSYLGLETDPRIMNGAIEAIKKGGVLLSSSRAYVAAGPNKELTDLMERIFLRPCLLMPLTNLASAAIITTRVNKQDAIILDNQVHMSVKLATDAAKNNGTYIETLPHNQMDTLELRIQELSKLHEKIWYLADGVYSMLGDFAPAARLYELMDKYSNFRVFIDDAHGMSWVGENGAGSIVHQMGFLHEQLYMVSSLGKGFGGQGAVAIFPNERERDIVKMTAPQLIFLSPLGNAALGADIASAELHLTNEIYDLQKKMRSHIDLFRETALSLNIPLANPNCESPIFYIGAGTSELCVLFHHLLANKGFYVNFAAHPAVPMHHSGIRIVLSLHQTEQDIKELLFLMHEMQGEFFAQNNISVDEIKARFSPYFPIQKNPQAVPIL